MIIFEPQKTLGILIPKTGCTSIQHAYKFPSSEPEQHHNSILRVYEDYPHLEEYFSFCFVRNPYSRLVSVYFDFKYNRKKQYSEKIKLDKPLFDEYDDFKDFVADLDKWINDVHIRPQHTFFLINNEIAIDYIARFERLQWEWDGICQVNGIKPVQLEKTRTSPHGPWQQYYDFDTKDRVDTVFNLDFEILEYKKEI